MYKTCTICQKEKLLGEFYKQKKKKSDGEEYFYYNPECRECTSKRSIQWQLNHPDTTNKMKRKYELSERNKKLKSKRNEKTREEGKVKKWRQENPEKIKEYNLKRKINKIHDITDEEWYACLDYFSNSCAYCGLSEQEQLNTYNHQFHREHVDHEGSNYIENCIPACTKCNTSKHDKEFNEWYNEENEVFSKRRLNRIIKWMTEECFKVLNLI